MAIYEKIQKKSFCFGNPSGFFEYSNNIFLICFLENYFSVTCLLDSDNRTPFFVD